MKAVIQRVSQAEVTVEGESIGKIDQGWLVLLGVGAEDCSEHVEFLANKIINLRAFNDDQGKMNLDLKQIDGQMIVVSQFTLFGDCRKGRRPSFANAGKPDHAQVLYLEFIEYVKSKGFQVGTGKFAHHMHVSLVNDGPVTLILDTEELMPLS